MFTKEQMDQLTQKANEIQQVLETSQQELLNLEFEAVDAANIVTVTINGRYKLKRISINPDFKYEKHSLEKCVVNAVNNAIDTVEKHLANKMNRLYSEIPSNI